MIVQSRKEEFIEDQGRSGRIDQEIVPLYRGAYNARPKDTPHVCRRSFWRTPNFCSGRYHERTQPRVNDPLTHFNTQSSGVCGRLLSRGPPSTTMPKRESAAGEPHVVPFCSERRRLPK